MSTDNLGTFHFSIHGDASMNNCFVNNTGGPSLDRVERNTQLRQSKAAQRRATVNVASPIEGGGIKAEEGLISTQVTIPKTPRFTLQRAATMMLTPTRPVGRAPSFLKSILAVIKSSCMRIYQGGDP